MKIEPFSLDIRSSSPFNFETFIEKIDFFVYMETIIRPMNMQLTPQNVVAAVVKNNKVGVSKSCFSFRREISIRDITIRKVLLPDVCLSSVARDLF